MATPFSIQPSPMTSWLNTVGAALPGLETLGSGEKSQERDDYPQKVADAVKQIFWISSTCNPHNKQGDASMITLLLLIARLLRRCGESSRIDARQSDASSLTYPSIAVALRSLERGYCF